MSDSQSTSFRRSEPVSTTANGADAIALGPFLALARELSTAIVPVRMRPEYRRSLERSLLAAARRQQAEDILQIGWQAEPDYPLDWSSLGAAAREHRWMIGAALGSAVSIAGIVAYFWRQRAQRAA